MIRRKKKKEEAKSKDDLLLEVIRKRVVTRKIREEMEHEEKERKEKVGPKQEEKKERRIVTIKEASVKTPVDDLYDAIVKFGKIRLDVAAKKFRVPESRVEEWGKILEENGLIEIHYPAIGKPTLICKEAKLL